MDDSLSLFKALSDGTRLKIVKFLLNGEKCVCEIIPHVGRAQPTVSLQLAKLERLGILGSRREGKKMLYRIKGRNVHKVFRALGGSRHD